MTTPRIRSAISLSPNGTWAVAGGSGLANEAAIELTDHHPGDRLIWREIEVVVENENIQEEA